MPDPDINELPSTTLVTAPAQLVLGSVPSQPVLTVAPPQVLPGPGRSSSAPGMVPPQMGPGPGATASGRPGTRPAPATDSGPVPPSGVVLVSGGSRGLGLAIVADLLACDVKVAAFARKVTAELSELAAAYPGRAYVGSVDVTDAHAGQSFVTAAEQALGPIDGIVNNAAIGQDSLHVHTPAERIAEIVTTNLTAPLVLTRFVLRRMLAKGLRGRIVNITSICAQRGFPGLVAYSATKGGMDAATRALARELGGRVLVNAVAPGFFASEMSAVLGPTQLDQIVRRTPTGRLTEPVDVLPVVRMLLCADTNVNGQVIVIDGAASV